MANNPFIEEIQPKEIPAMVYSANANIGELLRKSLVIIGFAEIKVVADEAAALEAMDGVPPKVVIMYVNMKDANDLATAKNINKKRASTDRRTPKIAALMNPTSDDILTAKKEGFWDILPLPATPGIIAQRLETVLTRLD
ncbi:MAG: hypothetical protein HQ503_04615 [Rhodospirillales bacterium]|nr:hypothetical protein [Rhodospirillales bacterium]